MPETWIVNSSPFISLSNSGYAFLLRRPDVRLLIPETVAAEIESGPVFDPARQELASKLYERVRGEDITQKILDLNLDAGESAVLSLRLALGYGTVILDDGKARRAAKSLGFPLLGTLGIVLRAKSRGQITSARDALNALRDVGLYLDEKLLASALPSVGETWP